MAVFVSTIKTLLEVQPHLTEFDLSADGVAKKSQGHDAKNQRHDAIDENGHMRNVIFRSIKS